MERIKKLERLIPKLKNNKKINTLKVEAMEWELRALKAEQQLKNCNLPIVNKWMVLPEIKPYLDGHYLVTDRKSTLIATWIDNRWFNGETEVFPLYWQFLPSFC